MTPAAFKRTLSNAAPPRDVDASLQGLWWAKKGDWEKAHRTVMGAHSPEAAWVHAYLHRVEGEIDNARYWYRQARQRVADGSLEDEWENIAKALLARVG